MLIQNMASDTAQLSAEIIILWTHLCSTLALQPVYTQYLSCTQHSQRVRNCVRPL